MPKGISLHIGVNYVNPDYYDGTWDGRLDACEADAIELEKIARGFNYKTTLLCSPEATIDRVIAEIEKAAYELEPGDTFFMTCSSHGDQWKDVNHDEDDGKDEAWILYDGELIDDQLNTLWVQFKEGVDIIVLSDSCHSETVTTFIGMDEREFNRAGYPQPVYRRLIPDSVARETYRRNKEYYDVIRNYPAVSKDDIKASIFLMAACYDAEPAYEGYFFGVFTGHLLEVWKSGNFSTYVDFFDRIEEAMANDPKCRQTPRYLVHGPDTLRHKEPFVF